MVQLLLDEGCNKDQVDHQGCTALILASKRGHTDLVKALIQAGVGLDTQDLAHKTALHWATEAGAADIVSLLAPVADINIKGHGGWSSLYTAAYHGDEQMVALLLSREADANTANDAG